MFLFIWCNPSCMTRVTKHAIRFRSEMQAQEGGGARKSSTEPSSQCASKVSPALTTSGPTSREETCEACSSVSTSREEPCEECAFFPVSFNATTLEGARKKAARCG